MSPAWERTEEMAKATMGRSLGRAEYTCSSRCSAKKQDGLLLASLALESLVTAPVHPSSLQGMEKRGMHAEVQV